MAPASQLRTFFTATNWHAGSSSDTFSSRTRNHPFISSHLTLYIFGRRDFAAGPFCRANTWLALIWAVRECDLGERGSEFGSLELVLESETSGETRGEAKGSVGQESRRRENSERQSLKPCRGSSLSGFVYWNSAAFGIVLQPSIALLEFALLQLRFFRFNCAWPNVFVQKWRRGASV
jgi:hypothetical protein